MSYTVTQRTSEIGIRVTLGAQSADVFRTIVGEGLRLALLGVGTGIVAALALTRVLQSFLFGVSAYDPLTFGGVALLLVVVAVAACSFLARRATLVDPMAALRYEWTGSSQRLFLPLASKRQLFDGYIISFRVERRARPFAWPRIEKIPAQLFISLSIQQDDGTCLAVQLSLDHRQVPLVEFLRIRYAPLQRDVWIGHPSGQFANRRVVTALAIFHDFHL
jgi:hypothetical protein